MRSLIILIIILILLTIIPSPYYKKTTTCIGDNCTSETSFELGPSLFKMLSTKLRS